MAEIESRSGWVLGLSLIQVILLLFFAAVLLYVTENVEVSGYEPRQGGPSTGQDADLPASLEAVTAKNVALEKQLGEMTVLVDEVKVMAGAKVPSKEGFQEAIAREPAIGDARQAEVFLQPIAGFLVRELVGGDHAILVLVHGLENPLGVVAAGELGPLRQEDNENHPNAQDGSQPQEDTHVRPPPLAVPSPQATRHGATE